MIITFFVIMIILIGFNFVSDILDMDEHEKISLDYDYKFEYYE